MGCKINVSPERFELTISREANVQSLKMQRQQSFVWRARKHKLLGDEAKRRPEMMQDFIASQVISAYRWMGLGLVDLEGGGPGDQPVKSFDTVFHWSVVTWSLDRSDQDPQLDAFSMAVDAGNTAEAAKVSFLWKLPDRQRRRGSISQYGWSRSPLTLGKLSLKSG